MNKFMNRSQYKGADKLRAKWSDPQYNVRVFNDGTFAIYSCSDMDRIDDESAWHDFMAGKLDTRGRAVYA
jgi:hypothetical protein